MKLHGSKLLKIKPIEATKNLFQECCPRPYHSHSCERSAPRAMEYTRVIFNLHLNLPSKDRLSPIVPVVMVKITSMVVLQWCLLSPWIPCIISHEERNQAWPNASFVPIRSHHASTWKRPWKYDPSSNHIFPLLIAIAQDILSLILIIPLLIEKKTTITM